MLHHATLLLLITQFFPGPSPVLTIELQPYAGLPQTQVSYVADHLKKIYPQVTVLAKKTLPQIAYYKPRNRYRADILLQTLKEQAGTHTVRIGLTARDISTTKGSIKDWGIMGLGYCPGKACVVSTFRLSKKNRNEELFKVAVHELGHTQGLQHCPVKTCLMRDAEGGNHLAVESGFCDKCKKVLRAKNWKI